MCLTTSILGYSFKPYCENPITKLKTYNTESYFHLLLNLIIIKSYNNVTFSYKEFKKCPIGLPMKSVEMFRLLRVRNLLTRIQY